MDFGMIAGIRSSMESRVKKLSFLTPLGYNGFKRYIISIRFRNLNKDPIQLIIKIRQSHSLVTSSHISAFIQVMVHSQTDSISILTTKTAINNDFILNSEFRKIYPVY